MMSRDENRPDVPLGYEAFYRLLERIAIALEKIAIDSDLLQGMAYVSKKKQNPEEKN